ncbi:MAG: DUF1189 family protein [Patescibacteria group bacterium]
MKTMFETFKKSVFSPEFYREVAEEPLKGGLRNYAKFALLLSVASVVLFSALLVPYAVTFVRDRAPELVREYYPLELVLKITNGEMSVNVSEPYMIATKEITRHAIQDWRFGNVVVIDTQNEFNKKKFEEYNTFALITKHEIVTSSNEGGLTIQEIPNTTNMVIDQETLLSWVEKVRGSLVYVVPFGVLLMLIMLLLGYLAYLVPLFLFALVPFLLARIKKIPLSYGGAYRISLYAIIPGIVLKSILNFSGIFSVPPYLTFLVFLLIVVVNLREVEQPRLFGN